MSSPGEKPKTPLKDFARFGQATDAGFAEEPVAGFLMVMRNEIVERDDVSCVKTQLFFGASGRSPKRSINSCFAVALICLQNIPATFLPGISRPGTVRIRLPAVSEKRVNTNR